MKDKYLNFSNDELRIKLKTLEHDYESTKGKITVLSDHLETLDKEYQKAKEILMKRTKGKG